MMNGPLKFLQTGTILIASEEANLLMSLYQVLASASFTAWKWFAIVDILLTVLTSKTTWAVARVVPHKIIAGGTIFTGIRLTFVDLNLTVYSSKTSIAVTSVSFPPIYAQTVRTAPGRKTIVNIQLTVFSLKTSWT